MDKATILRLIILVVGVCDVGGVFSVALAPSLSSRAYGGYDAVSRRAVDITSSCYIRRFPAEKVFADIQRVLKRAHERMMLLQQGVKAMNLRSAIETPISASLRASWLLYQVLYDPMAYPRVDPTRHWDNLERFKILARYIMGINSTSAHPHVQIFCSSDWLRKTDLSRDGKGPPGPGYLFDGRPSYSFGQRPGDSEEEPQDWVDFTEFVGDDTRVLTAPPPNEGAFILDSMAGLFPIVITLNNKHFESWFAKRRMRSVAYPDLMQTETRSNKIKMDEVVRGHADATLIGLFSLIEGSGPDGPVDPLDIISDYHKKGEDKRGWDHATLLALGNPNRALLNAENFVLFVIGLYLEMYDTRQGELNPLADTPQIWLDRTHLSKEEPKSPDPTQSSTSALPSWGFFDGPPSSPKLEPPARFKLW